MRKNKPYSAKINTVPPGNNPKMKKKNIPEEIEIYVDFQVW